jgi:hypothetical protein
VKHHVKERMAVAGLNNVLKEQNVVVDIGY